MNYRAPGKTHNIKSLSYLFNRKGTVMVLFLWWTCWSVSMNTVEMHRVTLSLVRGGSQEGQKEHGLCHVYQLLSCCRLNYLGCAWKADDIPVPP